jgi:hypothetical protein
VPDPVVTRAAQRHRRNAHARQPAPAQRLCRGNGTRHDHPAELADVLPGYRQQVAICASGPGCTEEEFRASLDIRVGRFGCRPRPAQGLCHICGRSQTWAGAASTSSPSKICCMTRLPPWLAATTVNKTVFRRMRRRETRSDATNASQGPRLRRRFDAAMSASARYPTAVARRCQPHHRAMRGCPNPRQCGEPGARQA